jgi:hypothetical protein
MKATILKNGGLVITDSFMRNEAQLQSELLDVGEVGQGEAFELGEEFQEFLRSVSATDRLDIRDKEAEYAILLHRSIRIDRRLAANDCFWHLLTLNSGIEYVRKRFGDTTGMVYDKDRFLGRWERNSLARLWWWCELTSEDGNYSRTKAGSVNQTFMMNILDNMVGGNKRIVVRLIDKAFPGNNNSLNESQIVDLFKRINVFLGTHNVDHMTVEELDAVLDEFIVVVRNLN